MTGPLATASQCCQMKTSYIGRWRIQQALRETLEILAVLKTWPRPWQPFEINRLVANSVQQSDQYEHQHLSLRGATVAVPNHPDALRRLRNQALGHSSVQLVQPGCRRETGKHWLGPRALRMESHQNCVRQSSALAEDRYGITASLEKTESCHASNP